MRPTMATRSDENVMAVPERIAQLQGMIEGIQHGQMSVLSSHAVIIGAIAIAFAIIIGGFTLLWINTDSVANKLNGRIDGLEHTIAQLPNQLIAIATAIGERSTPVVVTVPQQSPPAPTPNPTTPKSH